MFDIGFSEMILIGIVALMILGPERLPAAARTIGSLIAKLQSAIANLKVDIQQDNHVISDIEEFRQDLHDIVLDVQQRLDTEVQHVQHADTVMEQAVQKTMCSNTSGMGTQR